MKSRMKHLSGLQDTACRTIARCPLDNLLLRCCFSSWWRSLRLKAPLSTPLICLAADVSAGVGWNAPHTCYGARQVSIFGRAILKGRRDKSLASLEQILATFSNLIHKHIRVTRWKKQLNWLARSQNGQICRPANLDPSLQYISSYHLTATFLCSIRLQHTSDLVVKLDTQL